MKTNVMRILDASSIPYEAFEYDPNPKLSGNEIASLLKENPNSVFKTLITVSKNKVNYAFMIPVNKELDLKKGAKSISEKSIEMIPLKDLFKTTGYVHGGCSPIGLKKQFTVIIDESAMNFEYIYFSGGKVGCQVKVKTYDFINLIRPIISNIVK